MTEMALSGPNGIALRPEVDTEVLAVLAAAVDQAWPRPVVSADQVGAATLPAWRFSGRWWSRPATTRRERPWASG
jgi:hypothetical protein